jgi:hypothetical protein
MYWFSGAWKSTLDAAQWVNTGLEIFSRILNWYPLDRADINHSLDPVEQSLYSASGFSKIEFESFHKHLAAG